MMDDQAEYIAAVARGAITLPNLPHDLLLKAVGKHVKCKWALLYIERWLTAPMEKEGRPPWKKPFPKITPGNRDSFPIVPVMAWNLTASIPQGART
jgi:hypothetical protein